MDLTLHNARLVSAPHEVVDIGVADGRVVALSPGLAQGAQHYDLAGRLVVPGFCESHIHLDKACILERCSLKGGIQDAIAEVAGLKAAFTEEDVFERACRTLRKCVVNGTQHMRTHVEVDPTIGLVGFEGVKRAIDAFAWAVDTTICVFPQEGLTNNAGTEELMVAALQNGAHSVGAAPYVDTDPKGQIDRVFALARAFDVDIDMHLDFGRDPEGLDVEHVANRTEEFGWGGRVAVGHVTRFAQLSHERLARLAARLADVGIAVTILPATDLFLTHRDHTANADPPRGVTPVHLMAGHGVNCSLSTNNVLNPFTPYGDGSLIRMANLYANIAQIGARDDLAECLAMISDRSARLMNLSHYGITVGGPADMVVIDARDPAMAVAELAQPLYGFKAGALTFSHALAQLHPPAGAGLV